MMKNTVGITQTEINNLRDNLRTALQAVDDMEMIVSYGLKKNDVEADMLIHQVANCATMVYENIKKSVSLSAKVFVATVPKDQLASMLAYNKYLKDRAEGTAEVNEFYEQARNKALLLLCADEKPGKFDFWELQPGMVLTAPGKTIVFLGIGADYRVVYKDVTGLVEELTVTDYENLTAVDLWHIATSVANGNMQVTDMVELPPSDNLPKTML